MTQTTTARDYRRKRSTTTEDRYSSRTRGTLHSRPFTLSNPLPPECSRSCVSAIAVPMADVRMLSGTLVQTNTATATFPTARLLARVLLGYTLPINTRAVSRQAGWQPHVVPRPSRICQPVVETLSELYLNPPTSSYVPLRPRVTHNSFSFTPIS